MKKKILIIVAILAAVLMYVVPFSLVFVGIMMDRPVKFVETNNKVIIKKYNTELEVLKEYYDEEEGCYTLETIIEKRDDKEYNFVDSLEFTYTMKDKNGYVLGESILYLDNFSKNNKWKKNVTYCGDYADEVASFKLKEIISY